MANEEFKRRQNESDLSRRTYEEERLILRVGEAICQAMKKAGISKNELGRRTRMDRSAIRKILKGRNLTIKTLAKIALACGSRVEITINDLEDKDVDTVECSECKGRRTIQVSVPGAYASRTLIKGCPTCGARGWVKKDQGDVEREKK